jgi:hypothetical protein
MFSTYLINWPTVANLGTWNDGNPRQGLREKYSFLLSYFIPLFAFVLGTILQLSSSTSPLSTKKSLVANCQYNKGCDTFLTSNIYLPAHTFLPIRTFLTANTFLLIDTFLSTNIFLSFDTSMPAYTSHMTYPFILHLSIHF